MIKVKKIEMLDGGNLRVTADVPNFWEGMKDIPEGEHHIDHPIIIPVSAVGNRMTLYGLETPEEALEAILREHDVVLGRIDPFDAETHEHALREIDKGMHSETHVALIAGGLHPHADVEWAEGTQEEASGFLEHHSHRIESARGAVSSAAGEPLIPEEQEASQYNLDEIALAVKDQIRADPYNHEVPTIAEAIGHPEAVVAHVLDAYSPTEAGVELLGVGQGGGWLPEHIAREYRTSEFREPIQLGYRWPDGELRDEVFDIKNPEHLRAMGLEPIQDA